jgi:NAD(P)-dependent dehydrogenase (short-subunit alcohol dehydrogenase family)
MPRDRPPTALVTGATRGIGLFTALGLSRAGFRVLLHGRDTERAEAARRWLQERAPGSLIEPLVADLGSLAAVRGLARGVEARTDRLSVLVNNAGLFRKKREVSLDGNELILAVNYLAPFVLTQELLPLLQRSGPARIVNVGSSASDHAGIDLDDLQSTRKPGLFGMTGAYAQSKLALLVATFELARQLDGSELIANVVHPGLVATDIANRGGVVGFAWSLGKPFMVSPQRGAETSIHVALAPEVAGVTGRYFKRKRPVEPNRLAHDRDLARRLWRVTEDLVGIVPAERR